jgi:AraC-like DNA-binding protein
MGRLVTDLFIFIGVAMLVFAALLVTSRRKNEVTYWLAGYIVCVGYVWLYFGIFRANGLAIARWLTYSDLVFYFLAGPCLLWYTRRLLGEPKPRAALGWIPAVFSALWLAYLVAVRPGERLIGNAMGGSFPDYFRDGFVSAVNTFADALFFGYALTSACRAIRAFHLGSPRFRKDFIGVLGYYLVGSFSLLGFAAGHALRSDNVLGAAVLVDGINTTFLFFLSYRYPELTQRAIKERAAMGAEGGAHAADAGASAPSAPELAGILEKLRRVVEREQAFKDPDLSLQSLSTRLGIQGHRLSQILHDELGMSFRSYVNRYRLEEARRLLIEEPEAGVLDIAFEAGFNSKSAFNAAFVKETGLSPSEYRKKRPPRPEASDRGVPAPGR